MDLWSNTCIPCIDPDSTHQTHQGDYGIPPFQTHSCYFYAPLGEDCCGRHFVDLYYQQHHPFPHCRDCARRVLGAASHICWQCRTYFRRYGTGMLQQIMGVTPQRHDIASIIAPKSGPRQQILPKEERAQEWRDGNLQLLLPPILQVLLPPVSTCVFWLDVSNHLGQFQNQRCLFNLPNVPMPYHSEEALLPLPSTPGAGFRTDLSLHPKAIDAIHPKDVEIDPPLEQA